MPRRLSATEILRAVPPRHRVALRELGVDLDDLEMARLFIDGVRAADELLAKESAPLRPAGADATAEVNATSAPSRRAVTAAC